MPNKQAAIKDLRKNRRRAKNNLRVKTHVKSLYKKGLDLIKQGKKSEAKEAARAFQQAVDKAAKNHVISVNTARRKKMTLLRHLNKVAA